MKAPRTSGGLVRLILLSLVALSLLVFVILLGPSRAVRIAAAASSNALIDGFAESPGPHRIPLIDVQVDQAALDSLGADLPWSGGKAVLARLIANGVEHKARFRYRGVVTPSHYLGGKRSFRLNMKRSGPWSPYRRVNVINPKAHNLVNDHMACWVAGSMGVPVPMNEMVFTRINGEDHGVMELYEQVDGDFERNRHLWPRDVPVYKGDYPAIKGRVLPKGRTLWSNAAFWEYASDADSTDARAKLERLVAALQKDSLPTEAHRDSIAALIDVETYLRYEAALLVLNTIHIDQYHNQWLVLNPRTGRFYPVLWDALLLFAPPGEPLYYVNDAMSWWVLRVPEWRLKRDRYAYDAMVRLHREGEFNAELDAVIERITPSVLADRNKYGNVTLQPEDVHRVSLAHVIGSLAGLRQGINAHWERTLQRLSSTEASIERGTELRIRSGSAAPLRVRWQGDAGAVMIDGQPIAPETDGDAFFFVLHRDLVPPPGGKDHPLVDRQRLEVRPLDARITFATGIPASLIVTNAITDEPIR